MPDHKPRSADRSAADYYALKTGAIDRLLNARGAPKVSEAELRRYTSGSRRQIPSWLKILLVKFWFAGAVCYFFLWGLGMYLHGLDLLAVLAAGIGVVTDLMVNKILRAFEREPDANNKWMMVTSRKYWSVFLNVIYAAVLLSCVFQTYCQWNILLGVNAQADASTAEAMLGVEPILFGILYLGFDLLFLAVRNTLICIFRDAAKKASGAAVRDEGTR